MMRMRGILPIILLLLAILPCEGARATAAAPAKNAEDTPTGCPDAVTNKDLHIVALQDRDGNDVAVAHAKAGATLLLGEDLAVVLDAKTPLDPSCYVLFLDGHPINDLSHAYFDAKLNALVYPLTRTAKNADQWVAILGGPTSLTTSVTVALGERGLSGAPETPSVAGPKGQRPAFVFLIASLPRFLFAALAVIGMLVIVWGQAKRTTIMKDNLIPQIDPIRQPYSLGRWQMAVWFSLIFASYIFLYILLGDLNTLTPQALILMGISGATALAAVEVDVYKDTPPDAVNQTLCLLGIHSYQDVERIKTEIANREKLLANTLTPVSDNTAQQLSSEIVDRQLKLRTYEEQIQPYVSEGWFKDISTDINGPALHRVQVLCWTLLFGGIFLIGVWTALAMPTFSDTLLALMGVSGASYVGFKFPEKQQ